ncbi:MAG: phage holin family protein [Pigmentiphaga sp.]|nr:phage holin family protein [Pigmentiphaga sp.]
MTGGNPIGAIRDIAASVLDLFKTRFELAALELAEEKSRLLSTVLYALAGLLLLMLALLMFSFLLVIFFWDTEYRLWAIGGAGLTYGVIGLLLLLSARNKIVGAPVPFDETLAELQRDRDMLAGLRRDEGA